MVKVDRLPSGTYRARVNIGGGKYKTFTGKSKKEVQLDAAQFEAEYSMSAQGSSDYSKLTVREAIEKYVESKKNVISPSTLRGYEVLERNMFPSLLNLSLGSLTQEQIQVAVNLTAAEKAPKTVRNTYSLLLSSIKMFRPSFQFNITLPKKKKPEIIIPSEEDMIILFNAVHGSEMEIPILLAAISGLRKSEILGLRWSAIDFEKGTIKIEAAKVLDANMNLTLKAPKSLAGYRTVKLHPKVKKALQEKFNAESEFVTSLTSMGLYNRYQRILARHLPGKHYTFHELRHYACSVMIMLGIPTKYIADYLGHETTDMVERVYGHVMADKKDSMFDRLETYYDGVFSKCSL